MKVRALDLCAVACLFLGGGLLWGQATVNESLEKATLYVDGANGLDSNPGTQASPFKTIGKAERVADGNNTRRVGTHVWIAPGTYREAVILASSSKNTSLPMTFEAIIPGAVVISGADVWAGWQAVPKIPGAYRRWFSYVWQPCPTDPLGPFEQQIVLRREMVFVNGTPLTQVLTLKDMATGSFYVDETQNHEMYMKPAAGTDMNSATVEVSTRPVLFMAQNRSDIVLRGLTFEQGNSCRDQDEVGFVGSNNILVDNDSFDWGNAGGIGFSTTNNFTVQNSRAMHNGQRGFRSFEAKYGLWTANEADYSNWRGAQGGIYGWGGGGFHFFAQHNNIINGAKAFFNMTHGVHWDTDDENVTATTLVSAGNLRVGLFAEKSEGPISISNSYICSNSLLGLYFDGGLSLRASTYVTSTNNVIANNGGSQIQSIGDPAGAPVPVTNYETGQVYNLVTGNVTMTSSTIEGTAEQQLFDDYNQAGTAWSNFLTTLDSDNNTWWNGSVAQPFTEPVPAYFTTVTWPGWQSSTGQDKHSIFKQPAVDPTGPCQASADAPDYWFVNQDQGALTVTRGSSAVFTLLEIPVGGFNAATSFTDSGVAQVPGATSTWSQKSLPGTGVVQYTVTTDVTTPRGRYPLVLAAHSGNIMHTVTVLLTLK